MLTRYFLVHVTGFSHPVLCDKVYPNKPFLNGMAVRSSHQRGSGGRYSSLPHSLCSSLSQEEEEVSLSIFLVFLNFNFQKFHNQLYFILSVLKSSQKF